MIDCACRYVLCAFTPGFSFFWISTARLSFYIWLNTITKVINIQLRSLISIFISHRAFSQKSAKGQSPSYPNQSVDHMLKYRPTKQERRQLSAGTRCHSIHLHLPRTALSQNSNDVICVWKPFIRSQHFDLLFNRFVWKWYESLNN